MDRDGSGGALRRPGVAAVALASGATYLVAGGLSGLLLEEHGGVVGAVEWVLRTLVVIAAVVFVVSGVIVVLRVRRSIRSRALGWLVAVPAALAFAWFVAIPAGFAVYLTHLPSRRELRDADLGAPKQDVTVTGADGMGLRGWYVRSRNGAAVVAVHGTGSNRLGVEQHARLLVRRGYGVLALDMRGHGESDGRSTSLTWKLDDDIDGALAWLGDRRDVEDGRIGLVGVSMGGEIGIRAAARRREIRAVVAEGLNGGVRDASAAGTSPLAVAQVGALEALSVLLGGESTGPSDAETVERIAPRPLLLISAGRSTEADVNRLLVERAGPTARLWNLPDAAHAVALKTAPSEYERRVIGFLDDALAR